jgi:hypothetical protein
LVHEIQFDRILWHLNTVATVFYVIEMRFSPKIVWWRILIVVW